MNLNQITADLNFVSSSVRKITFNCNLSSISDNNKEFSLDIKCSKPTSSNGRKFGKLLMQINVSVLQENIELKPDTFELVIEGVFSSSEMLPDEEFLGLLNINGGAALYSVARAKIEAISSLVYADGKILLPMINIIQYFQERDANKV